MARTISCPECGERFQSCAHIHAVLDHNQRLLELALFLAGSFHGLLDTYADDPAGFAARRRDRLDALQPLIDELREVDPESERRLTARGSRAPYHPRADHPHGRPAPPPPAAPAPRRSRSSSSGRASYEALPQLLPRTRRGLVG